MLNYQSRSWPGLEETLVKNPRFWGHLWTMELYPGIVTLVSVRGECMSTVEWAGEVEPRTVGLSNGGELALTPEQIERVALVLSESPTWTPEEAARVLGVSRPMVVRWIGDGRLEDRPVGTHHRLPVESVLALRRARLSAGEFAVTLVTQATDDPEIEASLREAREEAAAMIERRDASR
jgi:excisionase family DNA binding protein